MKRSRVAIGAGIVVAGVVLYRRRRKPRASIAPMIPWLAYAAVNSVPRQSIDLSASTIFNNIAGFFGGVVMTLIGDIIGPIASAIEFAAGKLEAWIVQLWNELWAQLGSIPNTFLSVADYIEKLYNNATGFAQWLFDNAANEITNIVGTVQNIADGIAGSVLDTIQGYISDLIAVGGGLFDWVWQTFIEPLYAWVSQQLSGLFDWISQVVSDVINDGLNAGGWLYDQLRNIVNDLIGLALAGFADVIAVVQGAWNFLVWVAQHPLGWLENQLDELTAGGPDAVLSRLVNGIASNETEFGHFVDSWF